MEKKKGEKKRKLRLGKLYIVACFLSLIIGLTSLGTAQKISRSAIELNRETIKIPSYDEIIRENEKNEMNNIREDDSKASIVVENIDDVEKKAETFNEKNRDETVKPVVATVSENETNLTFTHPCEGTVMKKFSIDKPLKSKTMGDFRTHNGIDIKADIGDTVYATADGFVEKIYNDNLLGVTIVISHSDNLKTEYANIAGSDMVEEGKEIKKGDAIGCVGNTANGELLDEAHLHFAVIEEGKYVNPENYLKFE